MLTEFEDSNSIVIGKNELKMLVSPEAALQALTVLLRQYQLNVSSVAQTQAVPAVNSVADIQQVSLQQSFVVDFTKVPKNQASEALENMSKLLRVNNLQAKSSYVLRFDLKDNAVFIVLEQEKKDEQEMELLKVARIDKKKLALAQLRQQYEEIERFARLAGIKLLPFDEQLMDDQAEAIAA